MERGLLWLPLLGTFIWLAWAGWNEYQKVETYRVWAQGFQRAKYDIYAVLGQNGSTLTWGKPSRQGPFNLETFSLQQVQAVRLLVDQQPIELEAPKSPEVDDLPAQGRNIVLEFSRFGNDDNIYIPFTEVSLAMQWGQHFQRELNTLQGETST
ncbi:MAG: hypothetical protein VKJ46_13365 [Leptolyngbyaceae bacterium]|nr:hypothetical protein [Leptolyngbyaceae bacterium]